MCKDDLDNMFISTLLSSFDALSLKPKNDKKNLKVENLVLTQVLSYNSENKLKIKAHDFALQKALECFDGFVTFSFRILISILFVRNFLGEKYGFSRS